jgi:hypothetical protein
LLKRLLDNQYQNPFSSKPKVDVKKKGAFAPVVKQLVDSKKIYVPSKHAKFEID